MKSFIVQPIFLQIAFTFTIYIFFEMAETFFPDIGSSVFIEFFTLFMERIIQAAFKISKGDKIHMINCLVLDIGLIAGRALA
jgi:hypothetical protein